MFTRIKTSLLSQLYTQQNVPKASLFQTKNIVIWFTKIYNIFKCYINFDQKIKIVQSQTAFKKSGIIFDSEQQIIKDPNSD